MIKKIQSVFLVVALAFTVLISTASLSGCAPTCEVEKYIESVSPALTTWGETVELTKSTPRLVLDKQIEKLQATRDEVAEMEVQECLQEEHKLLVQAMDDEINGFTSFLNQEPASKVTAYFESYDENLQKWKDAVVHK